MATREYRPSGITTAVSGGEGWLARTGEAEKLAAKNIKDSAQRTWYCVTFPSTKRLELTRLGMIIHAITDDFSTPRGRAYLGQMVKSRNAMRTGVFMCARASFNSINSPRPMSSECSSGWYLVPTL